MSDCSVSLSRCDRLSATRMPRTVPWTPSSVVVPSVPSSCDKTETDSDCDTSEEDRSKDGDIPKNCNTRTDMKIGPMILSILRAAQTQLPGLYEEGSEEKVQTKSILGTALRK